MPVIDANIAATPKSLGEKSRATTGIVKDAMDAASVLPDIMIATLPTNWVCLARKLRIGYGLVAKIELQSVLKEVGLSVSRADSLTYA